MSQRLSERTELTSPNVADFQHVVDVSDTTDSASGTSKRITLQNIFDYLASLAQTLSNKTLTSPVLNGSLTGTGVKDEDTMTSDSATAVPTQQSTKAYVDTHAADTSTHGVGEIVGATESQTLTNKTLTKPILDATNPSAQTYSPAGAATATLDLSLANEHRITMPAGNITIALSNATNAQKFIVSILQDGVGSRTVTWFSTIRWAGGSTPTLTTTASKRDVFGFIRTGSGTYDGFVIGQGL